MRQPLQHCPSAHRLHTQTRQCQIGVTRMTAQRSGLSFWPVLVLGALARLALTGYGEWQDARFAVKYTDIDYAVVTDAAAAVAAGGSPFQRATYRYTPLLAWLSLPNVWLHPAAGKLIFCGADLLAGWLIAALLRLENASGQLQAASVAAWLLNPFTATISTRGSGEALVVVQLLLVLLLLRQGRNWKAAAVFGLAVHWRIYPMVYALPIALSLGQRGNAGRSSGTSSSKKRVSITIATRWTSLQRAAKQLLSADALIFGLVSVTVVSGLGLVLFRLYGWEFFQEAYLYHAVRRDPRHNFSPLYYPTYLSVLRPDATSWLHRLHRVVSGSQLLAVASLGWQHAAHLPSAFLLQTLAFVALNKVVTAQYFVWYFSLAPLVLPRLWHCSERAQRGVLWAFAAWVLAVGHWLAWAYLLEFQGVPAHMGVWAAGVAFVAANVTLLCKLHTALRQPPHTRFSTDHSKEV